MKNNFIKIYRKSIRKIKVGKPIEKKGFIILQIDGLSYEALEKALSLHLMPNLKKIIKSGGFSFEKYFTGVPSDTPFFQAGLLYGDNDNIPGFRWVERETGQEIIFKNPESAGQVEELLAKKNPGLLKGGSSYVNLFSGGASRSTFTLSTFSIRYLFKKKVRNFDIFIVFAFHIFTFLKTFFYVFFEVLFEIGERVVDIVKKREVRPEGFFPFARAMSNVIFKEIETFGAIMDISRGVPSIYLDYIGYDELSHHRGPYSFSALRTLKAIDRKIYNIYKEISKSERKYDFFIISDHGHTPSVPFSKVNGNKMLKSVIEDYINNPDFIIYEFDTGYNEAFKRLLLYTGDFFKKGTCSKIFNKISGRIESSRGYIRDEKLSWENDKIIYIMDSGPMANVYFSGEPSRMSVSKVEKKFKGLIEMLSGRKGIGFIAGIDDNGEAVVYGRHDKKFHRYSYFLNEYELDVGLNSMHGPFQERSGTNICPTIKYILNNYKNNEEKDIAFSSAERFCRFKNSGDLILFGEYNGKNIINFENQMGAHGGIGGEQNNPFAVWNKNISFDFGAVNNSCKIYEFLYNNYIKES
ncbi:MAG: alkaline phosphatase family protein [bacterium]